MKLVLLRLSIISLIILSWTNLSFGWSDDLKITGQKIISLPVDQQNFSNKFGVANNNRQYYKKVKIFTVQVSDGFLDLVSQKFELIKDTKQNINSSFNTPNTLRNLGMSNVPVLDQGDFGTCATFAVTAALDALKNVGDYISQQCLLELGKYEEHTYGIPSGWDGNTYTRVLELIEKYGVVNKHTCPHTYGHDQLMMYPDTYYRYSFHGQWAHDFNWLALTSVDDSKVIDSAKLEKVKQSINTGHRVLLASFLIDDYAQGFPIKNKSLNGLWALPKNYSFNDFKHDMKNNKIGGHATIITGYDDLTRLLKIRNSWGAVLGDHGDFYMTYDYFNLMHIETFEIY